MRKIVFFDADGTICDIKKEFQKAPLQLFISLPPMGIWLFYVPDEAGLLSQKIWLIWVLPV